MTFPKRSRILVGLALATMLVLQPSFAAAGYIWSNVTPSHNAMGVSSTPLAFGATVNWLIATDYPLWNGNVSVQVIPAYIGMISTSFTYNTRTTYGEGTFKGQSTFYPQLAANTQVKIEFTASSVKVAMPPQTVSSTTSTEFNVQ